MGELMYNAQVQTDLDNANVLTSDRAEKYLDNMMWLPLNLNHSKIPEIEMKNYYLTLITLVHRTLIKSYFSIIKPVLQFKNGFNGLRMPAFFIFCCKNGRICWVFFFLIILYMLKQEDDILCQLLQHRRRINYMHFFTKYFTQYFIQILHNFTVMPQCYVLI